MSIQNRFLDVTGTDFWRGSQFIRQGKGQPLDKEDAKKAGHIVSTFAESVDEISESDSGAASLGLSLRQKFQKVISNSKNQQAMYQIHTNAS